MNKKKVLLFDLEISPSLGYTWGKYEQTVIKFVKEDYLLCFAYKWLGQKTVKVISLNDTKDVVAELYKLFNEADIIVAHNGKKFDIKKANTYFAKCGLTPPSPYKVVDTLLDARRHFKFNSNKLDDLGQSLGVGKKLSTGGFDLWEKCMAGDKKAWSKMKRYNKQDVVLLEQVYLKLLAWGNHPDIGDRGQCPNCGSEHLEKRGTETFRNGKVKQRLHCQDCGKWSYMTYEKKA